MKEDDPQQSERREKPKQRDSKGPEPHEHHSANPTLHSILLINPVVTMHGLAAESPSWFGDYEFTWGAFSG